MVNSFAVFSDTEKFFSLLDLITNGRNIRRNFSRRFLQPKQRDSRYRNLSLCDLNSFVTAGLKPVNRMSDILKRCSTSRSFPSIFRNPGKQAAGLAEVSFRIYWKFTIFKHFKLFFNSRMFIFAIPALRLQIPKISSISFFPTLPHNPTSQLKWLPPTFFSVSFSQRRCLQIWCDLSLRHGAHSPQLSFFWQPMHSPQRFRFFCFWENCFIRISQGSEINVTVPVFRWSTCCRCCQCRCALAT